MKLTTHFCASIYMLLSVFSLNTNAQTTHPFEISFNAGTAWLQSDVKVKKPGGGAGYTIGNMYLQNATSPIDIGWRIQFLWATAYGQDLNKSTGIANNTLFNGTRSSVLNYKETSGFIYQNYKTDITEWTAELVIGANKLRETTHIYPYVFGGPGLVYTTTHTNQLDNHGQQYNYLLIDSISNGGKASSSNLKQLYDGTYETTAEGNQHPKWKFMPSLGIGLGFQVSKAFSIGIEHKMTWALNDVLDGQKWNNNNMLTGNNDIYHYSALWMKISFGRNPKKTLPPPTHPQTTTTVEAAQAIMPDYPKPIVVITDPVTTPHTSNQRMATITAQITNINSVNDITLSANGLHPAVNTYFYDRSTQQFNYTGPLVVGSNTFVVSATNQYGSDSKTTTLIYDPKATNVNNVLPAPVITVTNPTRDPFNTSLSQNTVSAVVQNVNSKSQIQLFFNGSSISNFDYSASTHSLTYNANLILGNNTIKIIATNASGTDTKNRSIVYEKQAPISKPEITIIDPTASPFYTNVRPFYFVEAIITNIKSENDVLVKVNGKTTTNVSYNPATKQVSCGADLKKGDNTIVITATNVSGSASKTQLIKYTPTLTQTSTETNGTISISDKNSNNYSTESHNASSTYNHTNNTINPESGSHHQTLTGNNSNTAQTTGGRKLNNSANTNSVSPPVVSFTSPSSNASSNSLNYHVEGKVLNVSGSSEISVQLNGNTVTNFSFNAQNHKITFDVHLTRGTNQITINGTNSNGSDSKTITVNFVGS